MKQNISRFIHSRLLRWMLLTGCFFLLLLTLFRVVFHLVYAPAGEKGFGAAFWMGFRYDARIVCVFLFIIMLAGISWIFRPFNNRAARIVLFTLTGLFAVLLVLFCTFDFYYFDYRQQRLNASVLSFAGDAAISKNMIWQTYPVVKILIIWLVLFAAIFFVTRFIYRLCKKEPVKTAKRNIIISYIVCFFVLGLAIFGRIGQYPLRWSDAYRLNSDYKASLALNPIQSFFSSLKFRKASFDLQKTKQYYSVMAAEMGVTDPNETILNFSRQGQTNDSMRNSKPNIVLVVCESFSAYKSSMWGNPLNTTPYFNELCKQGIFFKNCFSPAYGTARGIWALITGVPDVTEMVLKTASRNPNLVDQHTILNDIQGYEKFYFIGGSASWANIRGVLMDNIKDLHLYEQQDYRSPAVDVWGISDKDLFLEANDVIKKQEQPFFAIIQTADNHRPYTIPSEDKPNIKLKNFPRDTLLKYGFWDNEELNAYTYMDYTYKTFIEAVQKEKYFNNTIFVFVGDHGIRGSAGDMFPKVWSEQSLTLQHVPLLFYAPSLLKPSVVETKVSQIDIMPGIAYLAGLPATNTTLGRNIFADTLQADTNSLHNHAFILDPDRSLIGLLTGKYYYEYNRETKKEGVYSLLNNDPVKPGEPGDSLLTRMRNLTLGYYETSRYLLFNNKKKR